MSRKSIGKLNPIHTVGISVLKSPHCFRTYATGIYPNSRTKQVQGSNENCLGTGYTEISRRIPSWHREMQWIHSMHRHRTLFSWNELELQTMLRACDAHWAALQLTDLNEAEAYRHFNEGVRSVVSSPANFPLCAEFSLVMEVRTVSGWELPSNAIPAMHAWYFAYANHFHICSWEFGLSSSKQRRTVFSQPMYFAGRPSV